ncbi:hypothetical protein QK290_17335 [Pseudarthrobacter sp. AL07]|uniref:hypothetical protein n=1 Tax=unclassified Pseudarthrobacter TaxID=2647000 RepID=UPI00249AA367|nr:MULTISPECIES: hypothetical protein [unclassified Pseudarthrobacter]MDI3196151.1 hypothetical protein [Pseudarthrobacter sp. AL20]MDI3210222.1 hypothetical protein [Pseudarthrobacter sp. AL07]
MSEKIADGPQDHGPHQHAHAAPTTQQMRTVGQRRRQSEEQLEQHLEQARHRDDPRHDAVPEPEEAGPLTTEGEGSTEQK